MKEKILKLSQEGKKVREIATELKISESHVRYWLSSDYRTKAIERTKAQFRNMPKEKRQKYNESRREYNREYQKRKYHEDESYREKKKSQAREVSRRKNG